MAARKDVQTIARTRMARLRVERGITQAGMAEALLMSLSTYQRYERGRFGSEINLRELANIAIALQVPLEEIIEDEWREWSMPRIPKPTPGTLWTKTPMTNGHRVSVEWQGETMDTLDDLLRPGLTAVCVGINPAPVSVAAGHYFQGRLGQQFYARLRTAGVIPGVDGEAWEDDIAFAAGIGFTDVVKRPTRAADELTRFDFALDERLLLEKLARVRPPLLIFPFKKAAVAVLGRFPGCGMIGHRIAGADVYVMPGPYAKTAEVQKKLDELRQAFDAIKRTKPG